MISNLLKTQWEFEKNFIMFMLEAKVWAEENNIIITEGCGYCVKPGHHRPKSLHYDKLARDLNLYFDGVYLEKGPIMESYHKQLHEIWKKYGGADAITGDLNHYSVDYQGRK